MIIKAARARIKADTVIMSTVRVVEANVIPASAEFPAVYITSVDMRKSACYGSFLLTGNIEIGVYAKSYAEAVSVIDRLRVLFDDHLEVFESTGISFGKGEEEPDSYDSDIPAHVKAITFPVTAEKNN